MAAENEGVAFTRTDARRIAKTVRWVESARGGLRSNPAVGGRSGQTFLARVESATQDEDDYYDAVLVCWDLTLDPPAYRVLTADPGKVKVESAGGEPLEADGVYEVRPAGEVQDGVYRLYRTIQAPPAGFRDVKATSGTATSGYYPGVLTDWDATASGGAGAWVDSIIEVKLKVLNSETVDNNARYHARRTNQVKDGKPVYTVGDFPTGSDPDATQTVRGYMNCGSDANASANTQHFAGDKVFHCRPGVAGGDADARIIGLYTTGFSDTVLRLGTDQAQPYGTVIYLDANSVVDDMPQGGHIRGVADYGFVPGFGSHGGILLQAGNVSLTRQVQGLLCYSPSGDKGRFILGGYSQFGTVPNLCYSIFEGITTYDGVSATVLGLTFKGGILVNGGGAGSGAPVDEEGAQDAVGLILVDTDTIDFTYNDATPSISAVVRYQMSITSDASGLKLSGDSATPGNNKVYGTDGSGTKGWYDASTYTDEDAQDAVGTILVDSDTIDFTYADATPSITGAVRVQMSVTSDASGLKLSGDSATPGNDKYYGTNGSGTKGWYDTSTDDDVIDAVAGVLEDTDTIDVTVGPGNAYIRFDVVTQMSITSDASGVKLSGDSGSPGNNKVYGTDGSGVKGWYDAAGAAYTDEQAQDAIGTILVDSDTIDFTYADATPSITAAARVQMSITSDASGLKLSGDSGSPGNSKVYGTNGSGVKGWYDATAAYTDEQAQDAVGGALTDSDTIDFTYNDGAGTITAAARVQMSVTSDASGLKLSGDSSTPGNDKYYGTNGSGTKGWNSLPTLPTAATQSNMESEVNDTTLFAAPHRVRFSPGVAKAWLLFNGSTPATLASYNASCSRDSTGNYTVTWSDSFSSADYAVALAGNTFTTHFGTLAAGTITIRTRGASGADANGNFSIAAYGDI